MVLAGVVDAIFVDSKSIGQGADLDETIPITAGARQAGRFQTNDGTGSSEADFGDQVLKARPPHGGGSRPALVLVDDHTQLRRPAQRADPLRQLVLAGGARGVL